MASTFMSMTARSTATSNGCARSSRRSTPISPRSKPSMASGIDTATAEPAPAPPLTTVADNEVADPVARPALLPSRGRSPARRSRSRGWRSPISPLTRRILAVNVLALALLAGGFLYLGKYQTSLMGQQIESLKMQGEIFGAALGEGAVLDSADEGEVLLPDLARQMMRRLVAPTKTRARLFDIKGDIIADSRVLRGPGGAIQVSELPPPDTKSPVVKNAQRIYDWILQMLPRRTRYPTYHESFSPRASDYPEVARAL